MITGAPGPVAAALASLAGSPGSVAAQTLDPGVVADAPAAVRAAGAFGLVLAFGGVVLYRHGEFVERSTDSVLDRPRVAVFYGLIAYLIVLFVGGYGVSQLVGLGLAGTAVGSLGVVAMAVAFLLLTGLGCLVAGTVVTDVRGRRRPWQGLVLGATLGAVGWLVLPLIGGFAAWVVLAAFGIGGSTREWVHRERTVETEPEG